MTQQQFRLAFTVALAIVLVFGLYLGWHFTHHHQECGYDGVPRYSQYTCHQVAG